MVYWLRPVLVPFVVALLVVSGVTPILELMERTLRVNRLVASVIAFVTGLLVLGVLCICLWISVRQIRSEGEAYTKRVGELLTTVQAWIPDSILPTSPLAENPAAGDLPTQPGEENANNEQATESLPSDDLAMASPDAAPADSAPQQDDAQRSSQFNAPAEQHAKTAIPIDFESMRDMTDSFVRLALAKISAELFQIFSTSVIVLIYVFFILLGSAESQQIASVKAIDQQVRSYLFLKTVISIFTGICFGGALWAFGVPMSLTFGMLAFLFNYIPNVGPVVASLLPIPFILLNPDGSVWWMISAIVVTMAIQVVSGNVVEPKLMGDSSDLHPVVILLALMFWGMMWGITGMFLATPITAGIKIVLEGNASTKPVANVLAGRFTASKDDDPFAA
ncbi:MAG: AI-2E family transporter [Aureliella sp.]